MNHALKSIDKQIGWNKIDVVAGGETAGIPFAAFLAALAKKPMIYVRKQPKGFGRMAQIEGDLKPGKRVLLVEDLATDGGSKLVFIEALKKAEAKVTDCFVIFHYGIFPQSVEMLAAAGVKLHALATWWDALEAAQKHKYFDERGLAETRPSSRRPSNGRPTTAAARPRRARCWGGSHRSAASRPPDLMRPGGPRSARALPSHRRMRRCDGHDPPPLFLLLALCALAAPALAKDELVLGMTQTPGTWNPLISSMLAKSLISNMTARPLTAYDANSKLVCLVCTELPTIENGKARVIDLPDDGKGRQEGHGGRRRDARHEVGRRHAASPPRTSPSPWRSASIRCRAWPRPKATGASSSSTSRTTAISP